MIDKIKKIEKKLDVIEADLKQSEKTLVKIKDQQTEFGKQLAAALQASPHYIE